MNKKVNINIFYLSTFVTLLLTYIIPCKHIDDIHKSFGFPIGWFSIYNDTIGDIIMNSTAVNLISFLCNIIIFYFMIFWIYKLIGKIKEMKHVLNDLNTEDNSMDSNGDI